MREGDRRVQPSDQLPSPSARARASRRASKGGNKGLVVAIEQRVDQAERDGLLAARLRVELRDPRQ